MNIKSKRILAVSTIIAFAGLLSTPAFAEDIAEAVATTSVQTTGIIHVENFVVNDNLGTKTAADFEFSVTHFGADVEGSPFNITDAAGKTFILAPGTYVVAAASVDGYLGSWSGEGVTNGFIDLQAGQEITFTRNSYDIGTSNQLNLSSCNSDGFGMGTGTFPCTGLTTGQTGISTCNSSGNGMGTGSFPCTGQTGLSTCNSSGNGMGSGNFPCTAPVTEDGGTLPVTGTNWFNALALGLLLSIAGAYGFRKNSVNN
jgi:LPXTG-motif cell wall-anchored protein